jgi:hypothetical protein
MTAAPHIDPATAGMMAAIEADLVDEDLDQYIRFIEEGGVDPINAVDVIARGISQQDYREAIKAGATHQEILQMAEILDGEFGFDLRRYPECIEAGATHQQILEVLAPATDSSASEKGWLLFNYGVATRDGATHQEVLEVLSTVGADFDVHLAGYNWAISVGATHGEILEVMAALDDPSSVGALSYYGIAIQIGATHQEVLEAAAVKTSGSVDTLLVYSTGRNEGLCHQDIVGLLGDDDFWSCFRVARDCRFCQSTARALWAAIGHCALPELYCRTRAIPATTHEEALEAHNVFGRNGRGPVARVRFKKYRTAREAGTPHAAALADTRPPPSKSKAVPPNAPAELDLPIVNAKA